MTKDPLELFNELKERISGAFSINAISDNEYNSLNNELIILKPYIEYTVYYKVRISPVILVKRLEGLYERLKLYILNNKK